ncbi:inner membrane-spanning protein YciB [Brevundimonas aurifodinae]|uniref:Inner membrane-spanning protein YciB n=2 Tax=Brevundimonas TaxID=41275 RepID=A0ABV1NIG0_9CAUL|nr:MAG: intracellular septation protein A [Brevundimonas sp. 12-68-7]OYX35730.1 MAG: intracellular septation protein A [Brevundimonas subvibrioides]
MSDVEPTAPAAPPTWIRQVVDFGAIAAFALAFLVLRLRGLPGDEALVQATWALVAGAAVAVSVGLLFEKRLALMPLLVGGFALVFGVLTIVFNDDLFVKLKVTVLNASLAIALLGGTLLGKQPLKALLGTVIPVNDRAWRILTIRYGFFFLAVALVNEAVRSEALVAWGAARLGMEGVDPADVWVSFRGVLWIASSAFGLAQVPLIMKNLVSGGPVDPSAPARPDTAP